MSWMLQDLITVLPISFHGNSVSFSGQGAADQREGAQSSAAVWAHGGGALEAAGGAKAERGAPQSSSGGEAKAAARGGEGQANILCRFVCKTVMTIDGFVSALDDLTWTVWIKQMSDVLLHTASESTRASKYITVKKHSETKSVVKWYGSNKSQLYCGVATRSGSRPWWNVPWSEAFSWSRGQNAGAGGVLQQVRTESAENKECCIYKKHGYQVEWSQTTGCRREMQLHKERVRERCIFWPDHYRRLGCWSAHEKKCVPVFFFPYRDKMELHVCTGVCVVLKK